MTELEIFANKIVDLVIDNNSIIRVVSKDISFVESQIQDAAKYLKKDLIIWTPDEQFNNFYNYSEDKTPLRDRFVHAMQQLSADGIEKNTELDDGLYPIRSVSVLKNITDNTFMIDFLWEEKDPDIILKFWAKTVEFFKDILFVIKGLFIFDDCVIKQIGEKNRPNSLILLSTEDSNEEFANVRNYFVNLTCEPGANAFMKTYSEVLKEYNLDLPSDIVQQLMGRAMVGCESTEKARMIFCRILDKHKKLGLEEIPLLSKCLPKNVEFKGEIGEILSYVDLSKMDTEIGGLASLMKEVDNIKVLDTPEAEEYGLKPAKGIVLVGPPGCGKTIVSYEIAKRLNCPMVNFAVERVLRRYVGVSEELFPKVLKALDSLPRCIVLIDEIDMLIGDDPASRSHESTRRIIGTLLQYLGSRTSKPIFIITSNQLTGIPAEFIRAGRFDRIWFIDLPSQNEREQILSISLRKRKHLPFSADEMHELGRISMGFSGAELDTAVQNGLLTSFLRDKQLKFSDIQEAILNIKPLSASHSEAIQEQRRLAKQMGGGNASDNNDSFEFEMKNKQEDSNYDIDISYA